MIVQDYKGKGTEMKITGQPPLSSGLLRPDDREKMELILTGRSEGSYGEPARNAHGFPHSLHRSQISKDS